MNYLSGTGFQVNVAKFPAGHDPDSFIRKQGKEKLLDLLKTSQQFLDYTIERAAAIHDLANDTGRRLFLGKMLSVAAILPEAVARDQFADRIAHRAHITEDVVRAEIRRAAVNKRVSLTENELPARRAIKPAEKGLIWALIHNTKTALEALEELELADIEGLMTETILRTALALRSWRSETLSDTLMERLSRAETDLVGSVAAAEHARLHQESVRVHLRGLGENENGRPFNRRLIGFRQRAEQ